MNLDELNEKQKEAVLHTEGPLLIVAGAGAGKTKTVTYRIAHLIQKGIAPNEILAVTFTNKAAKEMRERVEKILEGKNYDSAPFISTFHALCVFIIKENAHLLGLSKYFTIADEGDAKSIIKDILKELDLDPKRYEPRKIKSVISKAKGDFLTQEDFASRVSGPFQELVARIWKKYESALKKESSLDFDDLLLEAVLLLRKHKDVCEAYQKRWKYIHVDEYQDTNKVQYELTKLLVGEKESDQNICVVGDTDQNIYSWRGANIKNMLNFEKDYPDAKIVMLEQNYRSTKTIIEAANEVIKKNIFRAPKNLFTENHEGESITIFEGYDEVAESNFVASTIYRILEEGLANPNEIAILYRANFQSRILEEAMIARQIPYQVLGTKFFDRKEIRDILSYLRAARNKESLSDIKRIINIPKRGIGKVTIVKLFANKMSELPAKMQAKINLFYNLLDNIKEYSESHPVSETIKYILEKSGIETELKAEGSEGMERIENIKELVTLALKYDDMGDEGIDMLLSDASLASDQDTLMHKEEKDGVRMMTVHASKGLEFKYVFITGLEQDLFPHARVDNTKNEDGEEERRLFYVAITRAEHKLYLSYAVMRTIFGSKQMNYPSEFLADIPPHLTTLDTGEANGDRVVYL